jgi:transcriptional regulator with XRE-family HTH domain
MTQTVGGIDIYRLLPYIPQLMISQRQTDLLFKLVGRRVQKRRKGRYSQEELADLIGVSRTSITNLERGRQRIPLHQVAGIAHALGCEISDLLPTLEELGPPQATESRSEEPRVVVGDLTPGARAVLERYTAKGGSNDESS